MKRGGKTKRNETGEQKQEKRAKTGVTNIVDKVKEKLPQLDEKLGQI